MHVLLAMWHDRASHSANTHLSKQAPTFANRANWKKISRIHKTNRRSILGRSNHKNAITARQHQNYGVGFQGYNEELGLLFVYSTNEGVCEL